MVPTSFHIILHYLLFAHICFYGNVIDYDSGF